MSANVAAVARDLSSEDILKRKQRTLWGDTWSQFRRHKLALFGLTVLALIVFSVLAGPSSIPVDPDYADLTQMNQAPSLDHPFGTDNIGRDLLARNLYGGRISLAVGISAMLLAIVLGTAVGALAGYFNYAGRSAHAFHGHDAGAAAVAPAAGDHSAVSRLHCAQMFGPEMGIFLLIVFVIGILGWMATARIVRSTVLSIKEKEFVEAAVNVGSGQRRILNKHILPNVMSPIIVSATLAVAAAILTESALSFLGLGFPSDVPTWGRLLFDGKDFMTFTPWVVIWPGLFISLVGAEHQLHRRRPARRDGSSSAPLEAPPFVARVSSLRTVVGSSQTERPADAISRAFGLPSVVLCRFFRQAIRRPRRPACSAEASGKIAFRAYLAAAYFSATLSQATTFHHAET